jgi:hypothetical protein
VSVLGGRFSTASASSARSAALRRRFSSDSAPTVKKLFELVEDQDRHRRPSVRAPKRKVTPLEPVPKRLRDIRGRRAGELARQHGGDLANRLHVQILGRPEVKTEVDRLKASSPELRVQPCIDERGFAQAGLAKKAA